MRVFLLLQLFLISFFVAAQTDIYQRLQLPDNGRVGEIVSPAEFLGYQLGERFTEYARSVEYFRLLAANSDRIKIEQYGETYERRPLLLLTISDAANMARLEDIRQKQLSLVSAFKRARSQVQGTVDEQPVINSYSYNIHGNEASSTEAAMQVAYELATSRDPALLDALKKTVNLLFVCINPDGRDRYVYWYNGAARHTGGQEPRDLEHYAPWPNGRTNHYWFDLNRDWVWGVHPESRGHTAAYQRWMPQVHTDYHEQGYNANYFTVPGTTPRNLLLPDAYEVWADTFGRANIHEFNKQSLSYFTRDAFDFYYPSYGSSYPTVMGAIGMLTEQGGIAAGRAVETNDGYVLTLRQRVYDHFVTSIAQVKAAARNRAALIDYSIAAWNPLNSKAPATAYAIEADGSEYVEDVINILLSHGVEVERATESFTAVAKDYRQGDAAGKAAKKSFQSGTYLVGTEQARHLFVNSLLNRDLQIEDSVMYDMSTWSAPLAYNLETSVIEAPLTLDTEPVTSFERSGGVVEVGGSGKAYAYVINWGQRRAPRVLAKLWGKGVRVRSSVSGFTADDGTAFAPGSLVMLVGRNLEMEAELPALMQSLAAKEGVTIHRFTTGRMADGNDLGSTRNFPIKQPRVALLVEPPFDVLTSGQIYWLFDFETELPVDRIRASTLEETDLPKFGSRYGLASLYDYDVLILPEARGLREVFGSEGQEHLKQWLSAGGTLVAIGSSAEFFAGSGSIFKDQPLCKAKEDTSEVSKTLTYAEQNDYYGKRRIPGSALHATLDVTHPLAFGLKDQVYALNFGPTALCPDAGLESVGRYVTDAKSLLASGYASDENLKTLAGNTWAGVRNYGQGRVVYFMENPHYRMFWRGPSRMMLNAVMVLPGS
ncbi:M14 family zinc carboxypeptidase [Neolewinella lacunae]|uniref:Peptidase M14 n=1 Tax=Neolewinella lacunae TaxID=1517758 RepID=A0A923PNN6_9BACT|nr:M14 family zinc carboxypeptidase [Neolewinella lacunae]MBC6996051.1 peptidase M14 [Neolewinella lacunae]MDN3636829.1 M14 family zinc carboxypeptidase [Neolewinella lacunae]